MNKDYIEADIVVDQDPEYDPEHPPCLGCGAKVEKLWHAFCRQCYMSQPSRRHCGGESFDVIGDFVPEDVGKILVEACGLNQESGQGIWPSKTVEEEPEGSTYEVGCDRFVRPVDYRLLNGSVLRWTEASRWQSENPEGFEGYWEVILND